MMKWRREAPAAGGLQLPVLARTLLLLLLCVSATRAAGGDYPFNEDETTDTYEAPPRVMVSPFSVTLVGTARELKPSELGELLLILEETVFDYASLQSVDDGDSDSELRWIKFNAVTQEFNRALQSVDVRVGAGGFRYARYSAPSETTGDAWVREALEGNLMSELKQNDLFSVLTDVYFDFKDPVDEEEEEEEGDGGIITAVDERAVDNGSSKDKTPIIAGSVAGAAVVVLVIGLLAYRRRRKQQVEIEDMGRLDENSKDSARGPFAANEGAPRRIDDGRSIADSESDWTVATEAGDSTALKSLHNNGKPLVNPKTNSNGRSGQMVLSESFERDRQVAISKDMLTGLWSGAVSPGQRGGRNDIAQSESVLQPSHFSASQERRVRRAAASSSNSNSPDLDSSSISSDEEEGGNELVFEQVDAWADQPPSPSRTSQSRTRRSPRGGGIV